MRRIIGLFVLIGCLICGCLTIRPEIKKDRAVEQVEAIANGYLQITDSMLRADDMNRLYQLTNCSARVVDGEAIRREQFQWLEERLKKRLTISPMLD